jgi:hypothetical protein
MPQFARPSADTNNPGAYTTQTGGSTNLYQTIDEVTADDADYIQSPTSPSSAVYVTKLSSITDPTSSAGHVMRMRTSVSLDNQENITITQELRQGYASEGSQGTLIASQSRASITSTTWTSSTYTLSGAEADAITDYTALYYRFVATVV